MRHCGVLLSTVSHTSGLSDRSPIDPDCGWLCSDKCWLGGSGRMGGGGREARSAALGGIIAFLSSAGTSEDWTLAEVYGGQE